MIEISCPTIERISLNQVPKAGLLDQREALFNDRTIGLITEVQVPVERITRLHAIMFDLDPKWLRPGNALFPPADEPQMFYDQIKPVLDRHPLADRAEVRVSGSGLHVLIWLEPAVELYTATEQREWGHIVKVVQRTLPVDPHMPGITALTRPVGSVNGKNGAVVETLYQGQPIDPQEVEEYVDRLAEAPFREVVQPLLGGLRRSPCPVCQEVGSELTLEGGHRVLLWRLFPSRARTILEYHLSAGKAG